ncbi:hypothetical protein OW763_16295 [Clostridium aestuarii]|uniref:DUF4145 domain-containing protein n=1 Tax=Clostridium aestuarii TaxID=338193 RepID=A0ABT4D5E9_9CLOT|nr:hypothetical protein [Clostridium aestuarii]MCY6485872.1 hypothetical protein [Clostridium aestuarii]
MSTFYISDDYNEERQRRIGLTIQWSKHFENFLKEYYGGKGIGLHQIITSIEEELDDVIIHKLRAIATIRNKITHENDFTQLPKDFEKTCMEVKDYLEQQMLNEKDEEEFDDDLDLEEYEYDDEDDYDYDYENRKNKFKKIGVATATTVAGVGLGIATKKYLDKNKQEKNKKKGKWKKAFDIFVAVLDALGNG